jgi:gluconolactonase
MAYPLRDEAPLGEGRVFFDATSWVGKERPGLPDGLKVDVAGNVFATGPGGVIVFGAAGEHLGTIETGVPTANCAFGDDGRTLYITANTALLRVRTLTKGQGF